MRSSELKIREYTSGKKRGFEVYGYLSEKDAKGNPKRIRKKFHGKNAKERALDFRHKEEVVSKKDQAKYTFRDSRISDEDEHLIFSLVEEIREQLNDHSTPFRELIRKGLRFFIDSPIKGMEVVRVNDAKKAFSKQQKFEKRSKQHIENLSRCLKYFCEDFGDRDIATISSSEIEAWIYERKASGDQTKLSEYRFLHIFFEWCKKKAIINLNVVSIVDKPEIEIREPVSLSIRQAEDLLKYSTLVDNCSMTPYVAVGIFAGLRPSEMVRAKWEDFDWDENILRVSQAKGRRYIRSVELPLICINWLEYSKAKEKVGNFIPSNHKKLFNLIRACAGFKVSRGALSSMHLYGHDNLIKDCDSENRATWFNDQMRHTAITYRLRIIKHIGEVAEWAGNTPNIINRNYKSVRGVSKASTKAFFSLTPSKVLGKTT